jgi:hypothetical protein
VAEWMYGVTTVIHRVEEYLGETLLSLSKAGFGEPHLFIDGTMSSEFFYAKFGLDCSCRYPALGVVGNWVVSMWEMYYRNPKADYYALFQDDLHMSGGAKEYLERHPFPDNGYANLYTVPRNTRLKPPAMRSGWFPTRGDGQGALGLVIRRDALKRLLLHRRLVDKPASDRLPKKSLDGMVVSAFAELGMREFVHFPSIVQHGGKLSTLGTPDRPISDCFRGEDFDLVSLL